MSNCPLRWQRTSWPFQLIPHMECALCLPVVPDDVLAIWGHNFQEMSNLWKFPAPHHNPFELFIRCWEIVTELIHQCNIPFFCLKNATCPILHLHIKFLCILPSGPHPRLGDVFFPLQNRKVPKLAWQSHLQCQYLPSELQLLSQERESLEGVPFLESDMDGSVPCLGTVVGQTKHRMGNVG